jgi:hypothetical protein
MLAVGELPPHLGPVPSLDGILSVALFAGLCFSSSHVLWLCRPEPLLGGAGPTFDSLAVEEAMQALGLPALLCDAACEVVADVHGDRVDGSVLPSALAVAGVTPVDALRVYAALVKVCEPDV